MDLSKYLPVYPDFDDTHAQETLDILGENLDEENAQSERSPYLSISLKNEFNQTKLERYEPKPDKPGEWMRHQIFMSRFLSSHTPYQSILLMHEPGTGKTCTSVAVIETVREEHTDIRGALVLMTGEGLINNYKNEIVNVCTDGTYCPVNYSLLNKRQRQIRITKSLDTFYEFGTYDRFSSMIQEKDDDYIRQHYSNKVIVLDEVHNLRKHDVNLKQVWNTIKKTKMEKAEKGLPLDSYQQSLFNLLEAKYERNIALSPTQIKLIYSLLSQKRYNAIHKFLHTVTNCKILLLSGTPMRDKPSEIIDIMNLILPVSKTLEKDDYFNDETLIEESKQQLKDNLKGHVSYLKSMKSDVRKEYVVNPNYELELSDVKLYALEMSKFQTEIYNDALKKDKEQTGIYSNSRQANLFVFPDGTYGRGDKNLDELRSKIRGKNNDRMIENIRMYSCKYAECIQKILAFPNESHFVYSEFVGGSGAKIFVFLLELFGFTKPAISVKEDTQPAYKGVLDGDDEFKDSKKTEDIKDIKSDLDDIGKKGKKYVILTSDTSSPKEITTIASLFNHDANMYGDYIQVVIGSSVVSEGFTLKNVRHVHILTPDWNFSVLDQVIARSYRLGSHNALIASGLRDISVKVYLYCAMPLEYRNDGNDEDDFSIDYHMFNTSRSKDNAIKAVERVLKEVSVDCYLNKERNQSMFPDDDNLTRECEYQTCEYECDGIPNDVSDASKYKIDYSTYNLYYDKKEIDDVINRLVSIFSKQSKMKLSKILEELSRHNKQIILKGLYQMIITNFVVKDRFGYNCFLRNEHDYLYLTHNAMRTGTFLDNYYVDNFPLQVYRCDEHKYLENAMSDFEKDGDINRFSKDVQEIILEKCFDEDTTKSEKIKQLFSAYFSTIEDGTVVSKLLSPLIRCKQPGEAWNVCTHEHKEQETLNFVSENSGEPIVGQIKSVLDTKKNERVDRLFLFEPSTYANAKNKKEQQRGCQCKTGKYQKEGLINLFIKIRIPIYDDYIGELNKANVFENINKIFSDIKDIKNIKNQDECDRLIQEKYRNMIKDKYNDADYNIDLGIRYIYWAKKGADEMCTILTKWLQVKRLLFDKNGKAL
uniref:Helicase ATP-binding domain-containing protein n=1 Tax=viral metagenome TaxID=1070528 RepID=A0A6C0KFV4_9ZZZZ